MEFYEEYLTNLKNKTDSLILYKNVLKDPVVKLIKELCESQVPNKTLAELTAILTENAEKFGFSGNLLKNHILKLFLSDENTFSLYCENNKDVCNSSLYNIALSDISIMKSLMNFEFSTIPINFTAYAELLNYIPVNKTENEFITYMNTVSSEEELLNSFIKFYNTSGCGDISAYRAFKYNAKKGLVGIEKPDTITFNELIGYESQTKTLIDNTEAFIKGYQANNVLLVGARGTGKSSSVKALANKYFSIGLRLLEITKEQITELPEILSMLKKRGRRFIIFIDDLSFDEQEIQYKYMKSLLEGGSESKPENVLFYATSNRRHLIQEKWSDRRRGDDDAEIHTQDTLNEKLSLSDRFGITITYPKPTPTEYTNMVRVMAKEAGLNLSQEILEKEALKWELNQKVMSGRTARQFVNNLLWQIKEQEKQ